MVSRAGHSGSPGCHLYTHRGSFLYVPLHRICRDEHNHRQVIVARVVAWLAEISCCHVSSCSWVSFTLFFFIEVSLKDCVLGITSFKDTFCPPYLSNQD